MGPAFKICDVHNLARLSVSVMKRVSELATETLFWDLTTRQQGLDFTDYIGPLTHSNEHNQVRTGMSISKEGLEV